MFLEGGGSFFPLARWPIYVRYQVQRASEHKGEEDIFISTAIPMDDTWVLLAQPICDVDPTVPEWYLKDIVDTAVLTSYGVEDESAI